MLVWPLSEGAREVSPSPWDLQPETPPKGSFHVLHLSVHSLPITLFFKSAAGKGGSIADFNF